MPRRVFRQSYKKGELSSPRHAILRRLEHWSRVHLVTMVILFLTLAWIIASLTMLYFESRDPHANITTLGKAFWWGLVTFMTVGYGDQYPVTFGGKIVAGGLMLSGVLSIAVITSKISTYLLEQILREGRGIVNTAKLKDHFVVCGWKEEMHELLAHILDFNPGMEAEDLVMIANVSQVTIDGLHEYPRLKGLQVIRGNYYEPVNLERANPQKARKILILADRTPDPTGKIASMTEVDARTIMTAMSLANIARGTLVTAEILDPKMDQYLRLASVSEIIYSREYSRLLLGNASGGTGIANVIFDLLDPSTSGWIATTEIEADFLGRTYTEFKQAHERRNPTSCVIGVLENTGNQYQIKELALRQAQKTPDLKRLLENLYSVKELRCNHPVFNPNAGYQIREGSMAIVIATDPQLRGTKVDSPGAHG